MNQIPASNPTTFVSSGTNFNLIDVLSMVSLISPFLIAFLMIMISIINSNVKGFIYLLGIIILFFINSGFQTIIQSRADNTNKFCNMFNISEFNAPYFNSALYMYTIFYILLAMTTMGVMNFPLIITFSLFWISDCILKYINKCASIPGIAMGSILGIMFGVGWFLIIQSFQQPGLLYYDDLISNKIACSRPTEQKFKCQVYKNGELIKSI
jgi:hypothetical protein